MSMYYPQPQPPVGHNGGAQNSWARQPHHPGLGQHPHSHHQPGPPPASPGYTMYSQQQQQHPHPHHQSMHHHQNSLSHYPSPPPTGMLHQGQHMTNGSPGTNMISHHWSQQLLKCDASRQSRSPHHRARASALAARTVAKSAIPITNPNAVNISNAEVEGSPATPAGEVATTANPISSAPPITEAVRPIAAAAPQNAWTSLDMGGVNIKQIPPTSNLFTFTFLINLYLNHNALTAVPPQICKLRHLKLLDLSGNKLTILPPEMGMLTNLKELYLFDNHIVHLPHEFGTLHQLQTIGVEGNPLEEMLKSIVMKDGTHALIAYLRDSCPVPVPPPTREWKHFLTTAERTTLDADPTAETFSALCYNILCERSATDRLYGYMPSWALAWSYRKELILTEIMNYDADFLCLQEVDIAQYEDYFTPHLKNQDYEGVFWAKSRWKTMSDADRRTVDGCATFYKASKYKLIDRHLIEFSSIAMRRSDFKKTDDMFTRMLGKDHITVVCLMESRETGTRFIIANAHLHWDHNFRDVKLVQTALMMDEIEAIANNFATTSSESPTTANDNSESDTMPRPTPTYADGTKIPLVICGDFNSLPDSGVYEYLASGKLSPTHPDFMEHTYGRYTAEGLKHHFNLRSAYALGELSLTNNTPSFKGVIDYIWYSSASVACTAILGDVDPEYLDKIVGFPNAHFPSDHLCLLAEFRIKPPRDGSARLPPTSSTSNGYHNT